MVVETATEPGAGLVPRQHDSALEIRNRRALVLLWTTEPEAFYRSDGVELTAVAQVLERLDWRELGLGDAVNVHEGRQATLHPFVEQAFLQRRHLGAILVKTMRNAELR